MAVFCYPSFLFRCPLSLKIVFVEDLWLTIIPIFGIKKKVVSMMKKMHDNLLYTHSTSVPKSRTKKELYIHLYDNIRNGPLFYDLRNMV